MMNGDASRTHLISKQTQSCISVVITGRKTPLMKEGMVLLRWYQLNIDKKIGEMLNSNAI